jgi:ribonuclease VapC
LTGSYVLDSFAIIALVQQEPGGERVRELLRLARAGEHQLLMSLINLGEVAYQIERRFGMDVVNRVMVRLDRSPIFFLGINRSRVMAAAHIKANHRLAYADAFAVALAQEHDAALVTGDPELRALGKAITVEWLG